MFQKVHFTTFTVQKNFYFFPLDFKNNNPIGTISKGFKKFTEILQQHNLFIIFCNIKNIIQKKEIPLLLKHLDL